MAWPATGTMIDDFVVGCVSFVFGRMAGPATGASLGSIAGPATGTSIVSVAAPVVRNLVTFGWDCSLNGLIWSFGSIRAKQMHVATCCVFEIVPYIPSPKYRVRGCDLRSRSGEDPRGQEGGELHW